MVEIVKDQPDLLGTTVIFDGGSFKRVVNFYRGWHPELGGRLHQGLQGQETAVEREILRPIRVFRVTENGSNNHQP
ncbi:hypothetical protein HYS96_04420 [Candidatus Daviesbacteria bacterium]|nr:hypothetical protein [Candidatus Daviesbacteria bacterium]